MQFPPSKMLWAVETEILSIERCPRALLHDLLRIQLLQLFHERLVVDLPHQTLSGVLSNKQVVYEHSLQLSILGK